MKRIRNFVTVGMSISMDYLTLHTMKIMIPIQMIWVELSDKISS
jgi:hypothetical protein